MFSFLIRKSIKKPLGEASPFNKHSSIKMNTLSKKTYTLLASLALLTQLASPVFAEVRLSGSVSLATEFEAKKAKIESMSSQKLQITPSLTARGLVSLYEGQADIAMVGGALLPAIASANKTNPDLVKADELTEVILKSTEIAFVINPEAKVTQLSQQQIVDVLTGKVSNWKDVGGADLPVKLFIGDSNNGWRIVVEHSLLKGQAFSSAAIERKSPKDIPALISQVPGSFSYFVSSMVKEGSIKVETDAKVAFVMSLVTKGSPSAETKTVIDAAKAAFSE